jgi:hypothetical protein
MAPLDPRQLLVPMPEDGLDPHALAAVHTTVRARCKNTDELAGGRGGRAHNVPTPLNRSSRCRCRCQRCQPLECRRRQHPSLSPSASSCRHVC